MGMNRNWRTVLSLVAFMIFFALGTALGTQRPNFTGTWSLAKDKSTNLPRLFTNVEEYQIIIKQADENKISYFTQFRGAGQSITNEEESYLINGSVIEREDKRGVKIKKSLRYDDSKPRLLIESEKRFTGEVQLPDTNETEVWELTDGGNTLTITITPKAEGAQQQVRVFTKSQ
jgi:hypothetical protein